ncbi:unnamed protein product [Merluccius merluccius]
MLESYVRGYLYKPQYSDEQLRLMEAEEQEAATDAACRDKRTSDCKVKGRQMPHPRSLAVWGDNIERSPLDGLLNMFSLQGAETHLYIDLGND